MGSLFYINVPVRKYEVHLRQQEHRIKVTQEKDDVAKDSLTGDIGASSLAIFNSSSFNSEDLPTGDKRHSTISIGAQKSGTNLVKAGSTVDIYEATVDGKRANIVVSDDSMAIYPESPKPDDHAKKLTEEALAIENAISNTFLEKHLEDCLRKFAIYDATWGTSIDGNFSQISFTCAADRSEAIINDLLTTGCGTKYESTLSVCAAIVYYNEINEHQVRKKKENNKTGGSNDDEKAKKDTFGAKFVASIKSRLTVAQVVQTVQNNAIVTFDYILLIIVAAIIAALGLLENSSVNLVASMLISPLMGPIMAGCFGAVIRDKKLIKTGIISEVIGLCLCFVVGFTFGVSVSWHPFDGPWAHIEKWPTDEMDSRSRLRGIVVGIFVAIPSGAGVALSILAGNAGSLVGVAISASLLPPAVNAGLLWGIAAVQAIHAGDDSNNSCDNHIDKPTGNAFVSQRDFIYCRHNLVIEFALMGICSFGLTAVNILIILITGAMVLKLKEVAPHTTRKTMKRFWKEDLKAMRDYNKIHGTLNKQEIYNELNELDENASMRDYLRTDKVFAQVTNRTMFGTSTNILDTTAQDAHNAANDLESTAGTEYGESKAPTGGGLWGLLGFGSKKAPNVVTESVETEPELEPPKGNHNRPHLTSSSAGNKKGRGFK